MKIILQTYDGDGCLTLRIHENHLHLPSEMAKSWMLCSVKFISIKNKILSKEKNKILLFTFYLFIIIIIFYFTILYWFCHISTCIHHGCTCVPHPEPPSYLPPHPIPLCHPSAPAQAPCIMHRTWTGNSFLIWYYTSQKNWTKKTFMTQIITIVWSLT